MTPIEIQIKELRDLKSWSQAELARRSGVGQSSVSRIEAGETSGISLGIVEKLAKALRCDPGFLIVKKGK